MMNYEDFVRLIESVSLGVIQPVKVEFERHGDPAVDEEIGIHCTTKYPNNSFTRIDNNTIQFNPLYEVEIRTADKPLYSHRAIFIIVLTINDVDTFDSLWDQIDLQKMLKEKQLNKTIWPILRQQVLDGMSRLALSPIPLPWIM